MKLIARDRCEDLIALKYTLQSCSCGNIVGKYLNHTIAEIRVRNRQNSRVIGLVNGVRYGLVKRGECFVIPWDDNHLVVMDHLGENEQDDSS